MEEKDIYPKGTKQETEDFATRQKIKKIVGEEVENIVKEETVKAFKDLGYKEKDGYMYIIASDENGKEREVGKGTQEGKLNVTISKPKMLNMGAVRPVSYMQKSTTFGGKRIISEIYLEIIDETVNISYKNTEASGFHQSSNGSTYAPRTLENSTSINGIKDTKTFRSKLKKFFSEIAEAEAQYLTGTKIGNSDKIQKDMNDSIIKENKFNMKLSDILSSSFEEAENKINKLVNESLKEENKEDKPTKYGTPNTPSGNPEHKKVVIGDSEEKEEESIDEITTSGGGVGGTAGKFGYDTPCGFSKNGKTPELNASKSLGYTTVPINEAIKDTIYGKMRTPRAESVRHNDGTYSVEVPMGRQGWPPVGMEHNYAQGKHGIEVNSKKELENTPHGDLNKVDEYKTKLDLSKRKFVTLKENEEKGINKRYIITEKLTKEEQSKRWKELYENDCFCNIKDSNDTITRSESEEELNRDFESNNAHLESDLCNTPFSGEEEGFVDVPKVKGSMIIFRLAEGDVRQNKAYIIDHFTKKLVFNPLYKSKD